MKEPKLRFKEENGMQFPDWEKSKFSDVFDNINNSTFSRDCLNYVDGNVKYIHYGDILTTFDSIVNVEASDVPYVNKDIDCQKYQLLADGDIIVADTAEDDTVGKAVEIVSASNVKVISGLHTIACRPKLKFTSGYLGYYMNSNPYHNQLRPYMQGVKVTSISKANIALTNVSIPSLPEQQKIASLFSEIDTLIQSAEKELDGYRELKQGMLRKMFPKKGEKVPEVRFPEFTDDWEQRKFGDGMDLLTGFPFESEKFSDNGINLIRGMNVKRGYLDLSDNLCMKWKSSEGLEKYLLEDEDILIQMDGALIGKSYAKIKESQLPALLVQRVTRARAIPEVSNSDFMYQTIQRDFLKYIILNKTDSAVPHLSLNDIREFPIRVPNLEEQKKIGEYFSNLDNLITLQQRELDGYKELKKGLLQQMFC